MTADHRTQASEAIARMIIATVPGAHSIYVTWRSDLKHRLVFTWQGTEYSGTLPPDTFAGTEADAVHRAAIWLGIEERPSELNGS